MTPQFQTAAGLLDEWRTDVLSGKPPVTFPHGMDCFEIVPGRITLIGAPPGTGKTAFVNQRCVEALRYTDTLRLLIANVEMSPAAMLERILAGICGVDSEIIRRRELTEDHRNRLAVGFATIESFADRLAFCEPPFDLEHIASVIDAHRADVAVFDYLQRIHPPGKESDTRLRASSTMGYLREFASRGIAVIAVSAVGRGRDSKGRSSYSPEALSMASYRDSSEVEFGCDDAFLLVPADEGDTSIMSLQHLKNRNGPLKSATLRFDKPLQSFSMIDEATVATTKPKKPSRRNQPKLEVEPEPAFSDEALAAMWGSTPTAADGDTDEGNK